MATAKKRKKNSGLLDSLLGTETNPEKAARLAREFHGRDNREVIEVYTTANMPRDVAMLGILVELQVITSPEDAEEVEYIPINFAPEYPNPDNVDNVLLGGLNKRPGKGQLYFVGGNQAIDVDKFASVAGLDLELDEFDAVLLGPVKAIAYFADKHHLEGPREQKKGIPYEHQFAINEETGEQIGEYPDLYYHPKEERFSLVGGTYEILPEGISG